MPVDLHSRHLIRSPPTLLAKTNASRLLDRCANTKHACPTEAGGRPKVVASLASLSLSKFCEKLLASRRGGKAKPKGANFLAAKIDCEKILDPPGLNNYD
jgi:hypothetical protein